MLFIAITILALLGTLFGRTFLRFREGAAAPSSGDLSSLLREYPGWLGDGVRALFGSGTPAKARALYERWVVRRYPGPRQWVFVAFAASFVYCAASGFLFAFFVPRGMFGVPLLLHVMAGGLFAVSLAAVLLMRARDYRPDAEGPADEACGLCPVLKKIPRRHLLSGLFWTLAAAGFVLAVTALLSMVSYLHFRAQQPLLEVHRYAALAALLAVILFFDFDVLPRRD